MVGINGETLCNKCTYYNICQYKNKANKLIHRYYELGELSPTLYCELGVVYSLLCLQYLLRKDDNIL
jgi:two-component SAPR family response regulator